MANLWAEGGDTEQDMMLNVPEDTNTMSKGRIQCLSSSTTVGTWHDRMKGLLRDSCTWRCR